MFRTALLLLPFALRVGGATFNAQGTNLTVTSNNLRVSFSGADIVGITNQVTGEKYLRSPSTNMQLNLTLVQAPSRPLAASGAWTVNSSGTTASLSFTDSNRTVSIAVSVDPATQEVVVDLDGKAIQGGLERLIWGVTGFDLTTGKFILPAEGGVSLTNKSFSVQSSFVFSVGDPAHHWDAPLSLFQSAQGGVAIYSTDTHSLFKDLAFSPNQQQTVNQFFEVEAPGPWSAATEAGPVEWRLAAYQGDWQSGARIYRDWHNVAVPPVTLSGTQAWASNIGAVVAIWPLDTTILDSLASVVIPSQTLLYLVDWRAAAYDTNYPDYTPAANAATFVNHAHQLGFYVMLHVDAYGVNPTSPDFPSVSQFQAKDPLTLQPQGWFWNLPASTPGRFAYINPAASAFRSLLIQRLGPGITALQPDALKLDTAGYTQINDGGGLIGGMNFSQGSAQLHRDLLAAFPNIVLGSEGTTDTIAPYQSFAQSIANISVFDSDNTPPVPISGYVLSGVRLMGSDIEPNADQPEFLSFFQLHEGQAMLPALDFISPENLGDPDMARFLGIIRAFQQDGLKPDWDGNWNGAVVQYKGTAGSSAVLTDTGTLVQFSLQQSGASTLLYQRVHASNQATSPPYVPNWPAYNGSLTLGLDPGYQYWLDVTANNPALAHITSLASGVKLGLGTGSLVTPEFAYFQLSTTSTPFDFFGNFWLANQGITYKGTDFPMADGAVLGPTYATVGGDSRYAIYTQPPYTAQRGGEVFFEYSVPVPNGYSASISFAAGILDLAIGNRQGPMTFKVEVNGAILWQQDVSTGGWQAGNVDLSPFLGQNVNIRFVSNPGPSGNPNVGWGVWSAPQLSVAKNDTIDVTLAVPPTVTSSNVSVTGGTATVNSGTATITGLSPRGTVLVFAGQPTTVSAGQSLLTLPFTVSQSSAGQLAGPSQVAWTGIIGSTTSGGITKPQTLYARSPGYGQTILSWYLQLPSSPNLALSFSAALGDGNIPGDLRGYLMSARVNGTVLWQYDVNLPAAWVYSAVDLSPWNGRTVLVELITDSQRGGWGSQTSWAELTFSAAGSANCASSLNSSSPISAPPAGAKGTVSVTTASGCNWTADGEADWITATPSSSAGTGTATYTIAPNLGPARQSTLIIAGHVLIVSQAGAPSTATPVISLVANAFGDTPLIAPNTWVEIKGLNLAPAGDSRIWLGADFVNNQLPTQLDGVSATVNGKAAYVYFISRGQANILTPPDALPASVQVQVTVGGVKSNVATVQAQPQSSSFFEFVSSGGLHYVYGRHSDSSLIGPLGLFPSAPNLTTPVKPAESIYVAGNGFGPTDATIVSGALTQSGSLPLPFPVVKIGGIQASVSFAGLIAVGTYQINLVVPANAPDGDLPLTATYHGLNIQPNLLITVHH